MVSEERGLKRVLERLLERQLCWVAFAVNECRLYRLQFPHKDSFLSLLAGCEIFDSSI